MEGFSKKGKGLNGHGYSVVIAWGRVYKGLHDKGKTKIKLDKINK